MENTLKFEYFETSENFKIEVTEFHPNNYHCFSEGGIPYALLIGKPINSTKLPEKVSILLYCSDKTFNVGEILTIVPSKKPKRSKNTNLIYLAKDTIINGTKKHWLLGSENKAIWGIPFLKENECKLSNGKYKVVYDKMFSEYPPFEFEVYGRFLTKTNSKPNKKYKIKEIQGNNFQLVPLEKPKDTLNEFQKKLISSGKPYYKITSCKKDTIKFILQVNLHVISNSGKFVRIN